MESEAPPRLKGTPYIPRERTTIPDLPLWPVAVLFAGFGVWWVLGLGAFAVAVSGLPMLLIMLVRGGISMPRGFLFWLLFILWASAAAVEIDGGLRLVGFAVRFSSYLGATVVFLYVYNLSRSRAPDQLIMCVLVVFAATVVIGGWLGVIFPWVRLSTLTQMLLPGEVASNDYVHALVSPKFAEVQRPYGSPISFTRPSAPFAYTNGWGCNLALLLPFIAAAFSGASRRLKGWLVVLLCAAAVPAAATLNRGMYIAITFAVVYAAIHYARKGRLAPLAALIVTGSVAVGLAIVTGLVDSLASRLRYSESNIGRLTTYKEAFEGTLASPLFGNGSPRPSTLLSISVGTQGQLWNVMFSYGFVALTAYLGWFIYAVVRSRSWQTTTQLWMHVVLVTVLLTTAYYGYDGPQLAVAMVAAAIALRPREVVVPPAAEVPVARSRAEVAVARSPAELG